MLVMMKLIFMMMLIIFMLNKNKYLMFYYNLFYFMSFIMIFLYINKMDLWMCISYYFGYDYYSYGLCLLTFWIMGLMIMSLDNFDKLKLMIFLLIVILLIFTFLSIEMILFYLFFELSLIPMFIMIIYWGGNPERLSAAYYLMLYTLIISLPLLIYIYYIYINSGSMNFVILMKYLIFNFSLFEYMLIYLTFFVKMPLYLFHIWLPKAHVEAPVYGSMILAAILLKIGSYGILRFMMVLIKFSLKFNYMILSVSLIGSLMVSLLCLVQIDLKSLVAYSSVVHMNMLVCSMLTLFKMGFISSYMIMVGHGLCSSGLFYMVNCYYSRTSSRLLMINKGLMNLMPSMSLWWFLLCSSNFSFPMSMNFIGEVLMLSVLVGWEFKMMIILMLISFFVSAYCLYLYSFIQHGEIYLLKFYSYNGGGLMKEFMCMILHYCPLFLIMLNLVLFM
uniref:NADH dehydrogenase subunit 4 n=1 Tax=Paraponera clavata TaxID=55425 RepID=UPI002A815C68|nr:NADH dehydrogenase subunit 4 [Paraponera clavata]WNO15834.1 NADH dehydrogenase subunit 4 [Paraponera clavata]